MLYLLVDILNRMQRFRYRLFNRAPRNKKRVLLVAGSYFAAEYLSHIVELFRSNSNISFYCSSKPRKDYVAFDVTKFSAMANAPWIPSWHSLLVDWDLIVFSTLAPFFYGGSA